MSENCRLRTGTGRLARFGQALHGSDLRFRNRLHTNVNTAGRSRTAGAVIAGPVGPTPTAMVEATVEHDHITAFSFAHLARYLVNCFQPPGRSGANSEVKK